MTTMIQDDSLKIRFEQSRVLILGDVMLDEYLYGDAERISPEAPVPVVRIHEEKRVLGGAGNVARNISSLGGQATLAGFIGDDGYGRAVVDMAKTANIQTCLCPVKDRRTTLKARVIAQRQQVVRFDYETIKDFTQKDVSSLLKRLIPLLDSHDVMIISDYNKGLISKDFMLVLRKLLEERPHISWLVDPKPQNISLFSGATIITPNAKETAEATGIALRSKEDILRAGKLLRETIPCKNVLATLSAEGMALFTSDEEVWHIPTVAQQVFDVTGAGDTAIATLALALAAKIEIREACVLANLAAGYVVSQLGTAALDIETLQAAYTAFDMDTLNKWSTSTS